MCFLNVILRFSKFYFSEFKQIKCQKSTIFDNIYFRDCIQFDLISRLTIFYYSEATLQLYQMSVSTFEVVQNVIFEMPLFSGQIRLLKCLKYIYHTYIHSVIQFFSIFGSILETSSCIFLYFLLTGGKAYSKSHIIKDIDCLQEE